MECLYLVQVEMAGHNLGGDNNLSTIVLVPDSLLVDEGSDSNSGLQGNSVFEAEDMDCWALDIDTALVGNQLAERMAGFDRDNTQP